MLSELEMEDLRQNKAAINLFRRTIEGVHVVKKEELARSLEHDTRMLMDFPSKGQVVPFFTASSAFYSIPPKEVDSLSRSHLVGQAEHYIQSAMQDVCELIEGQRAANVKAMKEYTAHAVVTRVFFVETGVPQIHVGLRAGGIDIQVQQEMAIIAYPARTPAEEDLEFFKDKIKENL